MNMILHDVHFRRFDLKQDDTLEHPQHMDLRFEAVVANPPFSAKWKGKDNPLNETDDRFSQYGRLAPATKADFAFIQQHDLPDGGKRHHGGGIAPWGAVPGCGGRANPQIHYQGIKLTGWRDRFARQPVLRYQYPRLHSSTEKMPCI